MLTQKTAFAQTYNTDTTITIRAYTEIYNDDVLISRSNPTVKTIIPGDDYSNEDADTKKMCEALWTPDVIAAYKANLSSE